jgi:hypothetical protein
MQKQASKTEIAIPSPVHCDACLNDQRRPCLSAQRPATAAKVVGLQNQLFAMR